MAVKILSLEAPPDFGTHRKQPSVTYEIDLLTPMLGGGTKSYEPDATDPVRAQSVKAQLRFWWRTFQEAESADVLRAREAALWGSTEIPSRVRIQVMNTGPVSYHQFRADDEGKRYPSYVLFPLFPLVLQESPHVCIIERHTFSLAISFPEDAERRGEVETAVKLWLLFGGVGSRVRRGCGSLFCKKIMEELATVEAIAAFINRAAVAQRAPGFASSPWPVFKGGALYLSASPSRDAVAAWKRLLDRYAEFRQGRGVGRRRGAGNRPGRSYWPEADALRRITGVYGVHKPEHPAGNWFPRGAYGMPVGFEFKNERSDPVGSKFFLQPDGFDRWPSPVFLKIIRLADNTLLDACLILNAKLPELLVVKENTSNLHTLSAEEMPLNHAGKAMPAGAPMNTGEHPYAALVRHLGLQEVQI